MPVKNTDNLLMARVVDGLIAQLINLGVEKAPLGISGSPWLFCVWNWTPSKWNGRHAAIRQVEETVFFLCCCFSLSFITGLVTSESSWCTGTQSVDGNFFSFYISVWVLKAMIFYQHFGRQWNFGKGKYFVSTITQLCSTFFLLSSKLK